MKRLLLSVLILISFSTIGSAIEKEIVLNTATGNIYGTLLQTDNNAKKEIIALLICGSGPTDRDGNNPQLKNNSIKYLAEALSNAGIPSVRYDKRGIAASAKSTPSEADLRFSTYVDDAKAWIALLTKEYKKVIVIGHSEGSTIGIEASVNNPKVAGLISVAGPGKPSDEILKQQMKNQPQAVKDMVFPIIDDLKMGKTVDNVPVMLEALFRKSVQPYLISWFKIDPAKSIVQIKVPILIIQGDKDIQVPVEEAELLQQAQPKAQKVVIPSMNHVFKECLTMDQMIQVQTYNNIQLKNVPKFNEEIIKFIKAIK